MRPRSADFVSQRDVSAERGHSFAMTIEFDLIDPTDHRFPQKNGARCRVRTCDPIRVKDVLYH